MAASTFKPVNGDAFREMCDHRFWHDAEPRENPGFSGGDAVFCKIDEVWRLFRALRRTRKRIVLVTHEGDKPVSPALWVQKPPHVAAWFGCNMFAEGPRAHPIPLGIGNADGTRTLSWQDIVSARDGVPSARDHLLYANFSASTNPSIRGPLRDWLHRPGQSWATFEEHGNDGGKPAYLRQLLSHNFVFCPPGNGEDTHRMWEALYLGAIPVARISPAMRAFSSLPIHFVPDLCGLTESGLRDTLGTWPSRKISAEMLDAGFWKSEISLAKEEAKSRGSLSPVGWVAGWLKEFCLVLSAKFKG